MKKFVLILALIAMLSIPAFAMDFLSAGIQLGSECGVVAEYEITDKIDGYINAGWAFGNKRFHASVAGLYSISKIDIKTGTPLYFDAGAELGVAISKGTFVIEPKAIASFSYNFKIQELSFTAFARLGLGVDVIISHSPKFGFSANIGLLYNL